MNGYREFWNQLFFGSKDGFAGTYDITEYWLRFVLAVALFLLLGVASTRFPRVPVAVSVLAVVLWVISVGPFILWAATCGGCGSSASYDSARSYEAMIINQAWGGLLATSVAAVWVGALAAKRLR